MKHLGMLIRTITCMIDRLPVWDPPTNTMAANALCIMRPVDSCCTMCVEIVDSLFNMAIKSKQIQHSLA